MQKEKRNMYYYKIAGVTLASCYILPSFETFSCGPSSADVTLEKTEEQPPKGQDLTSGAIAHRSLADGWFYHSPRTDRRGLFVSSDYTRLRMLGENGTGMARRDEWMVRLALECLLALRGYVSLHAAAVEVGQEAYAFSGPSGIGKSTRAAAWIQAFDDAGMISGDRPLIGVRDQVLYGVPWDGKEQCFRNVSFPLKAICEVRRADMVSVSEMSFDERRKLLMTQCFIPMWDTDTALIQMKNIAQLARTAEIVRVFCGTSAEDAVQLYELLQQLLDHA